MLLTDTFEGPEDALTVYENAANVSLLLEWGRSGPGPDLVTLANQIISDFFSSGFPLNEVSHAYLDAYNTQAGMLAKSIGVLPAISFVKAEGPIAKSFVYALHPLRVHVIQPGRFYFPNLQSICIKDIVLGSHSENHLSIESL